MNHEQLQELVNLFIDDRLNDVQSAEMFAHVSTCSECRNLMRSSLLVRSYYQETELAEVSPSLDRRVLNSMGVAPAATKRRNPFAPFWLTRILIPLPAAASICILILVGSLLLSSVIYEGQKPRVDNQIKMSSHLPPGFQDQLFLIP